MVAVNRGAQPATAAFEAPVEWGERPVKDFWKGEDLKRTGGKIEVTVGPRDARVVGVERAR